MAGFRSGRRIKLAGMAGLLALLLLALAAALAPLAASADGPHLNLIEVNTVNYPTIKVTFEALGADDLPITGLDRPDFAVYEDGQQQTVVSGYALQASSTPLTVMLALDTSLSMADNGKLQQARDAASAFVAQMRPVDRVGLIQFDSQYSVKQQFTSDRGTLLKQIEGLSAQGNTRLYDGLYLALSETATVDGSKAVVLLTDGQDTESAVDLSQVLQLIHDTGIRVYPIGIGDDIDERVLTQIASASGGHFYRAPTPADIGYAFRLMSDQLRDRYELVYSSPATAKQGTKVALRLTTQTPQGVASLETSYAAPAFARPSSQPSVGAGQPQAVPPAPAVRGVRTAYLGSGLLALGILLAAGGLVLSRAQRAHQARLAFFLGGDGSAVAGGGTEDGEGLIGALLVGLVRLVAALVTRMLPPKQVQRLSHQLTLAGNPFGWRVSHFVAVQWLFALAGAGLGVLLALRLSNPAVGLIFIVLFAVIGYRLPVILVKRRIKARQRAILRTLPDALDLLTICVEAGLGLDGAMLEVVNKWDNAISEEFAIVLAELKMGRSRREALRGLAERTDVQEVKTFTSALVQADELGMGIARPLALQAAQLRLKRRQRAEKLAHEAGIKMIVAMGLLIMPALFLILVSPTAVQLMKFFGS